MSRPCRCRTPEQHRWECGPPLERYEPDNPMYMPGAWWFLTVVGLVACLVPALMAVSLCAEGTVDDPCGFSSPVWAGIFWYAFAALPMLGISFLSRDMLRKGSRR